MLTITTEPFKQLSSLFFVFRSLARHWYFAC